MIWCDIIWYDVIYYDIIWYDIICYYMIANDFSYKYLIEYVTTTVWMIYTMRVKYSLLVVVEAIQIIIHDEMKYVTLEHDRAE